MPQLPPPDVSALSSADQTLVTSYYNAWGAIPLTQSVLARFSSIWGNNATLAPIVFKYAPASLSSSVTDVHMQDVGPAGGPTQRVVTFTVYLQPNDYGSNPITLFGPGNTPFNPNEFYSVITELSAVYGLGHEPSDGVSIGANENFTNDPNDQSDKIYIPATTSSAFQSGFATGFFGSLNSQIFNSIYGPNQFRADTMAGVPNGIDAVNEEAQELANSGASIPTIMREDHTGILGDGSSPGAALGVPPGNGLTVHAIGSDIIDDVSPDNSNDVFTTNLMNSDVALASGYTANLSGSGDIVSLGGDDTISVSYGSIDLESASLSSISGTSDVVTDEPGAQVNVQNTGSGTITVNLDGSNDYAGLLGGANYILNGSASTTGTWVNTSFTLNGSNDTVYMGAGDDLESSGGGNTIYSGPDERIYLSATNSNFDSVTVNDDTVGSLTADGLQSGLTLEVDTQANLFGNSNSVVLNNGDVLGAYGGGNIITAGPDVDLYLSSTAGDFDVVNANDDVSGEPTTDAGYTSNIALANDTQANLNGNGNTISLGSGDALGAYGGGNTIHGGADEVIDLSQTDGSSDTIYASGDVSGQTTANGQTSGIALGADAQAQLFGSGNSVFLYSGTIVEADDGNTINFLGTSANAYVSNATVDTSVDGLGNTIWGSYDDAYEYGNGDSIGFNGVYENAILNNGTVILGTAGSNATLYGTGDIAYGENGQQTIGFEDSNDEAELTSGTVNIDSSGLTETVLGSLDDVYTGPSTGDFIYLGSGSGDNIYINYGTGDINDAYVGDTFWGSDVNVYGTTGDSIGFNGLTENAFLSNGTVVLGTTGSSATVYGTEDTAYGENPDQIIGFESSGDVAELNGGTINIDAANFTETVLGNDDTTNGTGSGDVVDLYGTGHYTTFSDGSVNVESPTSAIQVAGSGDTINVFSADDTITTSGNFINLDSSSNTLTTYGENSVFVYGGADTVSTTNSTVTLDVGDTSESVYGSGDDVIAQASDETITVLGDSNTVTASAITVDFEYNSEHLTVDGSADVVNVFATDDTIAATGETIQVANSSTDLTVTGGNTIELFAANDTIAATNSTIALAAAASEVTVAGSANTIVLFASNTVVNASGSVIVLGSGMDATIEGSDDTIVYAAGDAVEVGGGLQDNLLGSDGSITVDQNAWVNVDGSGNDIFAATGDASGESYIGLTGGSNETVVASNDPIASVNSVSGTVYGSGDTILFGAGANFGVDGGANGIESGAGVELQLGGTESAFDTVYGSGDAGANSGIFLADNTGISLTGSSNSISLNSSDTLAAYGGGNMISQVAAGDTITIGDTSTDFDTVNGSNDTSNGGIFLNDDTQATINGSNDNLTLSNDDRVNASSDNVYFGGGTVGNIISGSYDNIESSNGYFSLVNGGGDNIYGSNDTFSVGGSGPGGNDPIYGSNEHTSAGADPNSDYGYGYDSTYTDGDYAEDPISSDDTFDQPFYPTVEGDIFSPGLSGSSSISTSANAIELGVSDTGADGSVAATIAAKQVAASAAGDLATSSDTLKNNPGQQEWPTTTITWDFAPAATTGTAPFSGALAAAEQSVVQSAMQTWASASGLTLQEVSSGSAADIEVGWGLFATPTSGLLGLTTAQSQAGFLQPGVEVRLEDPTETPLASDPGGDLAYADTGATLLQVALHEIGHALGLSDNSDPNSVMYYSLGSNNMALDATDVASIQQLYGSELAPNYGSINPTQLAAALSTAPSQNPTFAAM